MNPQLHIPPHPLQVHPLQSPRSYTRRASCSHLVRAHHFQSIPAMATAVSKAGAGEKWTGGLKDMHLDCPVGVLWELCSDWAHWDRFYPSSADFQFVSELKEGENRKAGCLRFAEVSKGNWTNERLLAIDNANYYFSYNMEENVFCGGLRNYVGKVQFRGTSDGKTVLEYWSYEVDPLTTMTREAFTAFIGGFLSHKLVRGMEAAAKKIAADRWTGGLKPMELDCPVGVLWELCSDWAHWDRFYPNSMDFQFQTHLVEGENRKVGCLRFAQVSEETWTNERLIAIDNANYYLSYNMEDNMFCGGLRNYVAKVQFRRMSDSKTMVEYWNFEVDPLTTMTQEEFSTFIEGFLSQTLAKGLEAAARKLANTPDQTITQTHGQHNHGHHPHGHHHHNHQ